MSKHDPIEHTLDIYGTRMHLAHTPKQWAQLRREINTIPENPQALALTQSVKEITDRGDELLHLCLWVDIAGHDSAVELIQTLAHEAAHAAGFIFEQMESPYDAVNEPYAYLVGWLAAWLWVNLPDVPS